MPAVIDTFTDTDGTLLENHVSDSGHIWTRVAYECRIINNELVASYSAFYKYSYFVNQTFTDCFVQARFIYTGGGGWGVHARYMDTSAVYGVSVEPINGNVIRIGRGVGLNFVPLGVVVYVIQANDVVRFEAVGNVLTCYVNNNKILSVTDSLYTTGRVGLSGDSYYTPKHDDFLSDEIVVKKEESSLRRTPSSLDWDSIMSRLCL